MGISNGNAERDSAPAGGGDARIRLGRQPAIRVGALVIEPGLRRIAHDDGREAILEPRVMQVLVALARSSGAIITREDLAASCWGGVVVGEDAITRAMGRLRRLAEGIGEGQFKVETIPRVGYRLLASRPAPERPSASPATARGEAALGDVLPRAPIALHGERRYIYALASDLQGFGELTHSLPPEQVTTVLNVYLDRISRALLEQGATIKIVGDAVVAFWGAPVSREDDGERATQAAIAVWQAGETFRTAPTAGLPRLGRTRVGLNRGYAVVGGFGGHGAREYTAVGDAISTASGLESACRALGAAMLVSREAIVPTMAEMFRPMGRVAFKGRAAPVEVFEAALDFPPEARERLGAAYARFDDGEIDALGDLSALAAEFPQDVALQGLVDRLKTVGSGGVFDLS